VYAGISNVILYFTKRTHTVTEETLDGGATFVTSRNPPAGESVSAGGELCNGKTLFHDTGHRADVRRGDVVVC